jgi:hypothetical protein
MGAQGEKNAERNEEQCQCPVATVGTFNGQFERFVQDAICNAP